MYYCTHCHILCEESPCPVCSGKKLRAPTDEDYCFLVQKPYLWADMLEAALRDNGIEPVCDRRVTGAWLTSNLGPMMEECRIYVPFASLPQAEEIVTALFEEVEFEEE